MPCGHIDISWHTLANIYIFTEAWCIPVLQNMAIDVRISKYESPPRAPLEACRYIYENTAERSPVRRFLAEWAAHRGSLCKDWFHDRTNNPIDFAIDLSLALYDRIKTRAPTTVETSGSTAPITMSGSLSPRRAKGTAIDISRVSGDQCLFFWARV